jgi:hypothetical protein
VKVGDLVKHFDNVGIVIRRHCWGRHTILWSCGMKQDIHENNKQIEVVSESW